MKTSTILIIVGVALAGVGVWFFFIRKKPGTTIAAATRSTFSPGPSIPVYRAPAALAGAAAAPMAPPVSTPGGGRVTVGSALEQGVALAATAGCAAAAGAYTGGAALPLCGLAGPLAVGAGQAVVSGAKAIYNAIPCIPIPFVKRC